MCIICQSSDTEDLKSTENGRRRGIEAASKKLDIVWERLRNYGDQPFEYHVNNTCYKSYTHIKSLKKLQYPFPSKSLKKLQVRKLYSFPSKSSNRVFCFQCYEKLHSTCWAAKARRRPTFL